MPYPPPARDPNETTTRSFTVSGRSPHANETETRDLPRTGRFRPRNLRITCLCFVTFSQPRQLPRIRRLSFVNAPIHGNRTGTRPEKTVLAAPDRGCSPHNSPIPRRADVLPACRRATRRKKGTCPGTATCPHIRASAHPRVSHAIFHTPTASGSSACNRANRNHTP